MSLRAQTSPPSTFRPQISRWLRVGKFFFSTLLSMVIWQLAFPRLALAQGPQEWTSINDECVGGIDNDVATIQGIGCLLANVFSVALTVMGLAAFLMLLYGAYKLMTAGSNPKGIDTARETIKFAVIGIVLALSSFIIINMIAAFTGLDVLTEFVIPSSEP